MEFGSPDLVVRFTGFLRSVGKGLYDRAAALASTKNRIRGRLHRSTARHMQRKTEDPPVQRTTPKKAHNALGVVHGTKEAQEIHS